MANVTDPPKGLGQETRRHSAWTLKRLIGSSLVVGSTILGVYLEGGQGII